MIDYTDKIRKYIEMEKAVLESLPVDSINEVMNVLENARLSRKRIFNFLSGG